MRILMGIILGLFLATAANAATFTLKSTGFSEGKTIPDVNSCEKGDVSPELHWENAPSNTKSFTLIMSSTDTPVGVIYGWILYNIPSDTISLSEDVRRLPSGTLVGKNSLNEMEYRGPCPPDGDLHRYIFTLYALDTTLDLSAGADIDEILNEMNGHILKQTTLIGTFSH
jgi:Raf kinase inhibitor-like YbhB/YbcL family protein